MTVANKNILSQKQAFVAQKEVGANDVAAVYTSPVNKKSLIKKIIITNNTPTAATFDISQHENRLFYTGSVFVAIPFSTNNTLTISTDGITWTGVVTLSYGGGSIGDAAYGNGIYLALASGGSASQNTAFRSIDGINWDYSFYPYGYTAPKFGAGKFVALQAYVNTFLYSTNGITWTSTTAPSAAYWKTFGYGNGTFVALSTGGSATTAISTDGITWTGGAMPSPEWWSAVDYGNGLFVAVVNNPNAPSNVVAVSTDAITWEKKYLPSSIYAFDIKYGNGRFVVFSSGTITVYSSTDGSSWTTSLAPAASTGTKLAYGNGVFVAVPGTATTTGFSSTDGISWTTRTITGTGQKGAVVFPKNSEFSTNNYLYKSTSIAANTTQVIKQEVMVPESNEIRVRSSVPLDITIMGDR